MSKRKNTIGELELRTVDLDRDRDEIFDLTGKCFGGHGYWNWLTTCRTWYIDNSHYDPRASVVGLIDGRIVTHWGAWGYDMRIGGCSIRVAGIGAVATDGSLRGRGLMARTAPAGIDAAAAAGYDATLLFGIPNFYHKFGYVQSWPGQTYKADLDKLPADRPTVRLRKFTPAQRDDLDKLYNARAKGLTGTAQRPTFTTPGRLTYNADPLLGYLWADKTGRTCGHVVWDATGGNVRLIDWSGEVEQVLRVLAMIGRKAGVKEVVMPSLHWDSPLAKWLRRNDCTLVGSYTKSGAAMMRMLDLRSTLTKIAPELGRRLAASHLAGWKGQLLIADAREKVVLDIGGPEVSVAEGGKAPKHAIRGGDEIMRLIIGSDEPGEIADAAGTKLTGDAGKLAEVLLPHQHPMLEAWDHF